MTEILTESLRAQFEAALKMLRQRIRLCPDEHWDDRIGEGTFGQDAYHVLFWVDHYLTPHEDQYVLNEFSSVGGDEREPMMTRGLNKQDTLRYLEYCHDRMLAIVGAETEETLSGGSGFPSIFRKRQLTRTEIHLYNLRHLQHHVGKLGAHLRRISDEESLGLEMPWLGPGWE